MACQGSRPGGVRWACLVVRILLFYQLRQDMPDNSAARQTIRVEIYLKELDGQAEKVCLHPVVNIIDGVPECVIPYDQQRRFVVSVQQYMQAWIGRRLMAQRETHRAYMKRAIRRKRVADVMVVVAFFVCFTAVATVIFCLSLCKP